MSKFNKLRNLFTALVAGVLAMGSVACSVDVDDTLGANLIPENQQMKAGYLAIDNRNPRRYV